MGAMCYGVDENYIFPLEEMISVLLSTLKIRHLSEEQMKAKLKLLYKNYDEKKDNITTKLREIFVNSNPTTNPNLDFHNKFFDLFIKKVDFTCAKNIMILVYPLLDNKKNLMADNFYNLLKEKFGKNFGYSKLEKKLYDVVEFYSYDLTELLEEELDNDEEREVIRSIMEKSFSRLSIRKFIEFSIEKDKLEIGGLWGVPVTFEKFNPMLKNVGLSDYAAIRSNLIFYER